MSAGYRGKKPVLMVSAGAYAAQGFPEEEVLSACSRAVWKAGGMPLVLPPVQDERLIVATLERASGWLLSGLGGRGEGSNGEWRIQLGLEHAMKKGIPILACGSACELLALFLGIEKDKRRPLPEAAHSHRQSIPKEQPFHPIELQKGSWLEGCLGAGQLMINALHGAEYWLSNEEVKVAARALDGATEAIEGRGGKLIGLRWNPEFLLDSVPCQTLIFRSFVLLARQHR